jgi:hypothetical protein
MEDHPGCYLRINKEGLNIISLVYYDHSIQKDLNYNNDFNDNKILPFKKNLNIIDDKDIDLNSNLNINMINDNNNNNSKNFNKRGTIESLSFSEAPSNFGSMESISTNIKSNEKTHWKIKEDVDDTYNNNQCILLNRTTPLNFGFSFYHVIKGDYQLYLHHSLINMRNARLILQVSINGKIVYTLSDFPSNELVNQDSREEKEKEKNIKLKEYLICSITKKMFEESNYTLIGNEIEDNDDDDEKHKFRDYEVRVTFKNQDLFWKAGWCIDGGRLLRKVYEVNESNVNKNLKRFKSEDINIFGSVNKFENKECNQVLRKDIKRNTLQVSTDKKI